MTTTITTEQAPSAKPISAGLALTLDWQTLIDVPNYDVPIVGFGTSRRVAPGVAEISSPLMITNFGSTPSTVSVRVVKADRPLIAAQNEGDFSTFNGGVGYVAGEVITLANGAEVTVDGVSNASVNAFTLDSVGVFVADTNVLNEISSNALGQNFSITVAEVNLEIGNGEGVYYFANEIPVQHQDTLIIALNGQFFTTGDQLQVRAGNDDVMHAFISYTEGQAEEDDLPTG